MRESNILRACKDYLQNMENMGKLWYERLNSGELIVLNRDETTRRVALCRKGTADLVVVWMWSQGVRVLFVETKAPKKGLTPEQEEFKAIVEQQGAEYLVVRDADQLIKRIES